MGNTGFIRGKGNRPGRLSCTFEWERFRARTRLPTENGKKDPDWKVINQAELPRHGV